MAKFASSDDDAIFKTEDFVAALEDIADVAPELIPYVVTCYPPELMLKHMSPEICLRLEQLKKSSYHQGDIDS